MSSDAATDIKINPYFDATDCDRFSRPGSLGGGNYSALHVAKVQYRKRWKFDEPIKLAMELPNGAWLAGEWFKGIPNGVAPTRYDLHFRDEAAFKNVVKRLQNAPEGSFFHGYEQQQSLVEWAETGKVLLFAHATKPTIWLHRARWYSSIHDVLYAQAFLVCKAGMDNALNLYYDQWGTFDDAKYKRLRVSSNVFFPTQTGFEILRLEKEGYKWHNHDFDEYSRREWVGLAEYKLNEFAGIARKRNLPLPSNDGLFGLYEA